MGGGDKRPFSFGLLTGLWPTLRSRLRMYASFVFVSFDRSCPVSTFSPGFSYALPSLISLGNIFSFLCACFFGDCGADISLSCIMSIVSACRISSTTASDNGSSSWPSYMLYFAQVVSRFFTSGSVIPCLPFRPRVPPFQGDELSSRELIVIPGDPSRSDHNNLVDPVFSRSLSRSALFFISLSAFRRSALRQTKQQKWA